MNKYQRGDKVKPGFYLDIRRGEFIQIDRTSNIIPENAMGRYVHIQGILAAIIIAILGLVLILFLPLAAIVGIIVLAIGLFRRRPKARPVSKPEEKQTS